jgi:hypothetical protein
MMAGLPGTAAPSPVGGSSGMVARPWYGTLLEYFGAVAPGFYIGNQLGHTA